jgi:hypothetical protein
MIYWDKNIVVDEIVIYSSKGKVVSSVNNFEKNSFSLLNLENGMYHILFLKVKKRVLSRRFIKE